MIHDRTNYSGEDSGSILTFVDMIQKKKEREKKLEEEKIKVQEDDEKRRFEKKNRLEKKKKLRYWMLDCFYNNCY